MSTILEQLQNIRASLSLACPAVRVSILIGTTHVLAWSLDAYPKLPYLTINDTDQLLEALAEELNK